MGVNSFVCPEETGKTFVELQRLEHKSYRLPPRIIDNNNARS